MGVLRYSEVKGRPIVVNTRLSLAEYIGTIEHAKKHDLTRADGEPNISAAVRELVRLALRDEHEEV